MEIDLAGRRDGVVERYVPELMKGELIEAEHAARYRWACPLAAGRSVLDAGCGTGYGALMLHEAGATRVLGVDVAEAVLDAVRPSMPEGVTLQAADLRALDLADDSIEFAVCMEVIEHFADPEAVLDELFRVLTAEGVLAISSPNRLQSIVDNPYHLHEYAPPELESALRGRFANVSMVGQRSFSGSLIGSLDDSSTLVLTSGAGGLDHTVQSDVSRVLLAVASDAPLPPLSGIAVLGPEVSAELWTRSWAAHQQALDIATQRADAAEARLADRDALQRRLVETEQLLAGLPERDQELVQALAERDYAVQWARGRVAALEAQHADKTASARYAERAAAAVRRRLR